MRKLCQGLFFYSLLPLLYLLALLPCWLLYSISDGCFYIVYYLLRYRREVVASNLQKAFPKATKGARKRLAKAFYHYFCDLLVEHIKSLTISPTQVARRCIVENPGLWEEYYNRGISILLATGHQGNWEWAGYAMALQTRYTLAVVYQPLSNPYFNTLIARIRTRFGRRLISQAKVLRTLLAPRPYLQATALLADQAPPTRQVHLLPFLHQSTYVDLGIGKLARRLNQPLFYVHITKIKRGYYALRGEMLCGSPSSTSAINITKSYIQCLEAAIKNQPATWLWSHNRWKQLW
jgi:KDO2-lipid IV(A) lauroyltransferase